MDSLRVSCIICTYRRTDTLPDAITSAVAQRLPSGTHEVVVVDNNSGDATPDIVDRLSRSASVAVRYVLEEQQGLSRARNRGISETRSDIVAFLDDDAVADPCWLGVLLDMYEAYPDAAAVGGPVSPIWGGPRPGWLSEELFRSLSLLDWGDASRQLSWPERLIGTNMSFPRAVLEEVGGFATDLGRIGASQLGAEDTEIQERLHRAGMAVYYAPRAVVSHLVPPERMTRRYFRERAFGSGCSEAILKAREKGRFGLLRDMLWAVRQFPLEWAGLLRPGKTEQQQGAAMLRRARLRGYLYQALRLTLAGDRRVNP